MSFSCTIIDISAKRMQRNTAFTISFLTSNFGTAKTTAKSNLDTFSTETHRTTNSLLHSTAECNTTLKLLRNVFSYESCIHIRLFDFIDVNVNTFFSVFFQTFFDLFNARTTATNYHTWFSRMNGDLKTVLATLRLNLGHTGRLKTLLQIVTDFNIFMQVSCKIFICIPLSIPSFYDAKTNTMRIYFLTQSVSLLLSSSRLRR